MASLKNILFRLCYVLGVHRVIKFLFQRHKATILLFHELPRSTAPAILEFLNSNYSVIPLEDYTAYRRTKKGPLPKYPLIITFDDGRKSNMELIDLFAQYGNVPTIYICANRENLDGNPLFDEEDLRVANQYYDLQAHTISHPNLKEVDMQTAKREIMESKTILQDKLGKKITSFAYPYGSYRERDVELAQLSGYENALTVDFGFNSDTTSLHKLKRICISDRPDVYETALKTCGLWGYIKMKLGYNINYSTN